MSKMYLYPFKQGNKWGYRNLAGEVVLEPRFDAASKFDLMVARVAENGLAGLLNTSGEYLLEPVCQKVERRIELGMYQCECNGGLIF